MPDRRRIRAGLLAVNAALLGALGVAALGPSSGASAQGVGGGAAGARPAGRYILLSARSQGASAESVFVLDTANAELAAVRWVADQRLELIGYRNLRQDAAPPGAAQPPVAR